MSGQNGKVILLGSEGCGSGDDTLGFEILVALLDVLPARTDRPDAIVFWNTAVQLLSDDSPLLERIKYLQEKGVDILAGKLCVQELGLTDRIAIGKLVTMNELLDILLSKEVISL
jgi:hypothetical protein